MERERLTDSIYVSQGPCPKCDSDRRFTLYSDGSQHCHKCNHHVFPDGASKETTKPVPKDLIQFLEYLPLSARKISQETCEKYGYGIGVLRDQQRQVAAYTDVNGNLVAHKVRHPDKSFEWLGEPKKAALFGQHLFQPHEKKSVVVTEGEIDCLSFYQVNPGWPCVSIKNGASGAAKQIAEQLEWLERFQEVIFMFDMDEPGKKAALECVQVLSFGKGKMASLPLKDPNEMLVAGRVKELLNARWNAVGWKPKGVYTAEDVAEDAKKPIEWGLSFPWKTLTEGTNGSNGTFGMRLGEVYGYAAGTGVGKTTAMWEVAAHLACTHGQKVGLIPFENDPAESLQRIAGTIASKPFHVPNGDWTQEDLTDAVDTIVKSDKFFFAGRFEDASWEEVKLRTRYLVKAHGVQHVFLDNLTAVVAMEDDEVKAFKKIMKEMAVDLAKDLNITFHYLSHLNTPEGKSHEEGGRVMLRHLRGSRTITHWSHFVFGMERDTQDSDAGQECIFRCLKDRKTGRATGLTFPINYNHKTGRLSEAPVFSAVAGGGY